MSVKLCRHSFLFALKYFETLYREYCLKIWDVFIW